jgi:hypothetical protein
MTFPDEAPDAEVIQPPATGKTGHPKVDEALAALRAAAELPPAEQIAPLTEAHQTLRETLDSIGDV